MGELGGGRRLELVFAQDFHHPARERQPSGEHLPEDDAQAVEIAAAVDLFTAHALLGAGVGGRADEPGELLRDERLLLPVRAEGTRQAEVNHLE